MKDKQILIDYKEYLELERKAERYRNLLGLLSKVIVNIEQIESPVTFKTLIGARLDKKTLCELLKTDVDTFYF